MGIIQIIVCCFFVVLCNAQNDSIYALKYRDYDDKLSVQLFTLTTSNTFSLYYPEEDITVDIEPNQKMTLGASVQYDIVSFSLGFAPSFFAENRDNADSKMVSFSFTAFPGRLVQHGDIYYQRGISLKTEDYSLYFDRLKSLKIAGSTSYVFNKNFSYRSILLQNARQIKSAGSFVPTLFYNYTELNSKGHEELGFKDYFVNIALTPGYYYNWVIARNFMVSAGLGVGAGVMFSNSASARAVYQGSALLGLGYNSDRFFAGINSRGVVSSHETTGGVTMDDSVNYATIFMGYRFDAPSFLVKEKEKIKQKLK